MNIQQLFCDSKILHQAWVSYTVELKVLLILSIVLGEQSLVVKLKTKDYFWKFRSKISNFVRVIGVKVKKVITMTNLWLYICVSSFLWTYISVADGKFITKIREYYSKRAENYTCTSVSSIFFITSLRTIWYAQALS